MTDSLLEGGYPKKILIPKKYQSPTRSDICVAMSFFNPLNYKKRISNANYVLKLLLDAGIPTYLTELLYPDQKSSLIYKTHTVYSNSIAFCKENLWNITEETIDSQYTKVIFLDADVLFSDVEWIDKSSIILDDNDCMQPMQWTFNKLKNLEDEFIDLDLIDPSQWKTHKSTAYEINKSQNFKKLGWAGYALGVTRNFYHKIGGFFDQAVLGSGDALFWSCKTRTVPRHLLYNGRHYIPQYQEYMSKNKAHFKVAKIGYLADCWAMHLHHGSFENRNYSNRQSLLKSIDVQTFYNQDGVLEVDSKASQIIKGYFASRNEDDES